MRKKLRPTHLSLGCKCADHAKCCRAADATSHLFFAYLRSLSPGFVPGADAILSMPRSLQALLQATEYPPETPTLMQHESAKVIMIVDTVSPTPFALLRRAKHFDYRDDDRALQAFAAFDDPVEALTEESRRVVRCISSINQSHVPSSTTLTGLRDGEWSRFEDIGFSSLIEDPAHASGSASPSTWSSPQQQQQQQPPLGLRSAPQSQGHAQGRPTTPSWADFLSAGFVEGGPNQSVVPHLLPPDKVLPPIGMTRAHTAQPATTAPTDADGEAILEPGELASITLVNLDASFWWVWMTSLAAEEPPARKAVFGRCAVVETGIAGGRWLVMEEKVKGAAPLPVEGAHIVEKKSRFSLTKRGRGISWRGKTSSKNQPPPPPPLPSPYANSRPAPASKVSIGPDQHARIQAAASALQQKQKQQQQRPQADHARRARTEDVLSTKTNSVFTLQPIIMKEAAPAMQWANRFDHDNVRDTYLSDEAAGRGQSRPTPTAHATSDRDLPALPQERRPSAVPPQPPSPDRKVLPSETRSPSTETPPFASPRQDAEAPPAGGPQLDSQARPTEQYFPSPAGFEAVPPPYCREQSPPPESSSRPEPPPSQPEHYSTTRPTEAAEVHLPNGGLAPDSPEARKAHKRLQKRSADRVGGGAGAGLMRIFGKKSLERPSSRPTQEESWSFVDVSSPSDASVGAGAGVDDRRPSEPRSTTSQHEPMPVSENAGAPEVMDRRRPEPPALERLETQQQQPPPKLTNAGPASDSPLPPQSPPYAPQQLDEVPAYATEPNCGAAPDSPTSPLGPPARASNERVADGFSEAIEVDRSYDVSRSSSPGTDAAPAPVIAPARRQAPVAASTPAPASTRRASPAAAAAAAAAMAAASSSSSLSSQSQQPAQQQPSQPPPPDRWAQIRKNAAERAAKRISVDPSRPVGGETNGEECKS